MTGQHIIWNDKDLKTITKCRIVNGLVFPVVLCGCDPGRYEKQRGEDFTVLSCGAVGDCYGYHGLREERTNQLLKKFILQSSLPVGMFKV